MIEYGYFQSQVSFGITNLKVTRYTFFLIDLYGEFRNKQTFQCISLYFEIHSFEMVNRRKGITHRYIHVRSLAFYFKINIMFCLLTRSLHCI